jgi:hypothetical protein
MRKDLCTSEYDCSAKTYGALEVDHWKNAPDPYSVCGLGYIVYLYPNQATQRFNLCSPLCRETGVSIIHMHMICATFRR